MIPDVNICDLFRYGGVLKDVEGKTAEEVYRNICSQIELPASLSSDQLYAALCQREKILTTAVGNGFAIPHARTPLIKDFVDQKIVLCYLKEPIDMSAPDGKKVSVMFVILTSNPQSHMQVISRLAGFLKNATFKKAMDQKVDLEGLLNVFNYI